MPVTGSNRVRGFTLFEMLAVLLMLGVVAALMAVPLKHALQRMDERKTVNALVATLRLAHQRALSTGETQTLQFDLRARRVVLTGQPPQSWPPQMQIRLETAQGLGAAYAFFPDGAASGGNIVLRGQQQWRIDISWLTGAVRLSRSRDAV